MMHVRLLAVLTQEMPFADAGAACKGFAWGGNRGLTRHPVLGDDDPGGSDGCHNVLGSIHMTQHDRCGAAVLPPGSIWVLQAKQESALVFLSRLIQKLMSSNYSSQPALHLAMHPSTQMSAVQCFRHNHSVSPNRHGSRVVQLSLGLLQADRPLQLPWQNSPW